MQRLNGLVILERARVLGSIVRNLTEDVKADIQTQFSPYVPDLPGNLTEIVEMNHARLRALGNMSSGFRTTLRTGEVSADIPKNP